MGNASSNDDEKFDMLEMTPTANIRGRDGDGTVMLSLTPTALINSQQKSTAIAAQKWGNIAAFANHQTDGAEPIAPTSYLLQKKENDTNWTITQIDNDKEEEEEGEEGEGCDNSPKNGAQIARAEQAVVLSRVKRYHRKTTTNSKDRNISGHHHHSNVIHVPWYRTYEFYLIVALWSFILLYLLYDYVFVAQGDTRIKKIDLNDGAMHKAGISPQLTGQIADHLNEHSGLNQGYNTFSEFYNSRHDKRQEKHAHFMNTVGGTMYGGKRQSILFKKKEEIDITLSAGANAANAPAQ